MKTRWINETVNIFLHTQETEPINDCLQSLDFKFRHMIQSHEFDQFTKVSHLPVIIVPKHCDSQDLAKFAFLFDHYSFSFTDYLKKPFKSARNYTFEPIDINQALQYELERVELNITRLLGKYHKLLG
ncbi:MAG: hypothetical protein KDD94_10705 [Calditrichaeota bacterium]|nr:hypothetical protein [Calditrichota bacterium]